jgi:hypothetical protein
MPHNTKECYPLPHKPRNQIPVHQETKTKPKSIPYTSTMCKNMAQQLAIIQPTIDNLLQHEAEEHYNNLNKKLDNLQRKQKTKTTQTDNKQKTKFYPRTVNLTNITFTKEEMNLLDLGLQHSFKKPANAYCENRTSNKST